MSVHIIIDGYNLIRQSAALSSYDQQDIQMGREALLDVLSAYKRMKRHRITVVFDGGNADPYSSNRDYVKGICVKFSHRGESADTVIKRMAARERELALVVSSDHEIVDFAASHGAATISSPGFEAKISLVAGDHDDARAETEDAPGWVPTTRKKGPRRRLSKRKRRNRMKIRKL